MNGNHRATWLSDIISETQKYIKQASKRSCPEVPHVQQALNKLFEARDVARGCKDTEPDDKNPVA